jgi:DNA-damage-inducible protein J
MNTTINIRIDKKTKAEAQKTLEAMGMDLSSAIKIFLKQVIVEDCLPFRPNKIGGLTRAQMDKEVEYALKHGKRYNTAEEMSKDILGEKLYARYSK